MTGIKKTLAALGIVGMAVTLPGCLVEMLMTTAATADMAAQNAGELQGTMNQAKIDVDKIRLQEAVDLYAAEKGAYPADLTALVPTHIEAVPLRPDGKAFGYNPIEGEVYDSADGPAPADYIMMENLKTAINAYGTQTGYYPATLDVLYPTYVPTPPRTATGKPFGYNNFNGEVTHPDEGKQHSPETLALEAEEAAPQEAVKPVNAIGSLGKGDLKDSNSLNKALDRIGY